MTIALTDYSDAPAGTSELMMTVDEALELLDEERDVFLRGAYDRIAELSDRKIAVLERLELTMSGIQRSAVVVGAVSRLISASRRNEQIIEAARQGLVHARRRIGAIQQAVRGAVAYAEDGSRIASHADMIRTGKSF